MYKNLKLKKVHVLRLSVILSIVFAITTSCNAKGVKAKKTPRVEVGDSLVKKAIGDSIYAILMDGKITSMLVSNSTGDVKYKDIKILSREDQHLVRFLITDTAMVVKDVENYGVTMPNICFKFQKTKKEFVNVNFDFGLKKWNITNAGGEILAHFGLAKYDMLRFCHYLYAEDELIKNQYKSIKK